MDDKVKRARSHLLKGKIGEVYTKYLLQSEGYKTFNLNKANKSSDYLFYFLERLDCRDRIMDLLKGDKGIPDFICRKGNEIIFVEVKTNNADLSKNQVNFFRELKKEFPVFISNINFSFDLKDAEMMECEEEYLNRMENKIKEYEEHREKAGID